MWPLHFVWRSVRGRVKKYEFLNSKFISLSYQNGFRGGNLYVLNANVTQFMADPKGVTCSTYVFMLKEMSQQEIDLLACTKFYITPAGF